MSLQQLAYGGMIVCLCVNLTTYGIAWDRFLCVCEAFPESFLKGGKTSPDCRLQYSMITDCKMETTSQAPAIISLLLFCGCNVVNCLRLPPYAFPCFHKQVSHSFLKFFFLIFYHHNKKSKWHGECQWLWSILGILFLTLRHWLVCKQKDQDHCPWRQADQWEEVGSDSLRAKKVWDWFENFPLIK